MDGTGEGTGPGLALAPVAAPESDFDELAIAAAEVAGAHAAVIALPRGKWQWFRGSTGVAARSAAGAGSLAEAVALGGLEVDIADVDGRPEFADDVLFRDPAGFRSAVCFPLAAGEGPAFGTLIVLSAQPLILAERERALLRTVCRQIVAQLQLRRLRATEVATHRRLGALESRCQKLAVNQFADAQALAQLGTWEWDATTGHMTWSAEVYRIFGLTALKRPGLGPSARQSILLVHPDEQAYCRRFIREVLKTGNRTSYRMRTLPSDGFVRHIEGWAEAELDPVTGRSIRVWGTAQDITDRVRREAALAESEQRLRVTIETSPIGFALVGLDGGWLQVNRAMAQMVGYSPEQLMQLRFQDITHPDDLDADLALLAELNAGSRTSYQMDKRYVRADGTELWANLTASIVRREDGTPLHYVAQVQDITDRRRAVADLQEERDLSAALLGALHDGYAYLEKGRVIVVNDVFCEMTGVSRLELTGRSNPFSFLGDSGRNSSLLHKIINDKSGQGELVLDRPDGTALDVSIQVRPARRADGRVRGYVALLRDITDRKIHEQRLRHRADHDGLTGLLNRAAFHVRLTERVAAAHASGSALTLAILDLDRFKLVNDEHGHPAGDAVLAEFADRLRGNARGDDVIGRLGGEEFGWIMSDTGREEAIVALGRTLDAVRRHPFPHGGQLTFSAGAAQLRTYVSGPGEHGEQPELIGETAPALVQRTDRLLYEAKASGRDRVVAAPEFEPPLGLTGPSA